KGVTAGRVNFIFALIEKIKGEFEYALFHEGDLLIFDQVSIYCVAQRFFEDIGIYRFLCRSRLVHFRDGIYIEIYKIFIKSADGSVGADTARHYIRNGMQRVYARKTAFKGCSKPDDCLQIGKVTYAPVPGRPE